MVSVGKYTVILMITEIDNHIKINYFAFSRSCFFFLIL